MTTNQKIERAVVWALIKECAKEGFRPVSVWDGGKYVPASDAASVEAAVFAVDESTIHFAHRDDTQARNLGVLIVCGNGEDCISDWHCSDSLFDRAVTRASERAGNPSVSV